MFSPSRRRTLTTCNLMEGQQRRAQAMQKVSGGHWWSLLNTGNWGMDKDRGSAGPCTYKKGQHGEAHGKLWLQWPQNLGVQERRTTKTIGKVWSKDQPIVEEDQDRERPSIPIRPYRTHPGALRVVDSVEGGDPFTLLPIGETHLEGCVQFWG